MSHREIDELLKEAIVKADVPVRYEIVVIDDDQAIREGLSMLFGERYQVTACGSAEEGVAMIHEDVCAVILDVKMPKKDGFLACEEIQKRFPTIPVIFYSAYQSVKDPYAIINEHRPFGYVYKGEDVQWLVEMVDAAVRIQSVLVSNRRLLARLQLTPPKEP